MTITEEYGISCDPQHDRVISYTLEDEVDAVDEDGKVIGKLVLRVMVSPRGRLLGCEFDGDAALIERGTCDDLTFDYAGRMRDELMDTLEVGR